jgi:hypothetical protein
VFPSFCFSLLRPQAPAIIFVAYIYIYIAQSLSPTTIDVAVALEVRYRRSPLLHSFFGGFSSLCFCSPLFLFSTCCFCLRFGWLTLLEVCRCTLFVTVSIILPTEFLIFVCPQRSGSLCFFFLIIITIIVIIISVASRQLSVPLLWIALWAYVCETRYLTHKKQGTFFLALFRCSLCCCSLA